MFEGKKSRLGSLADSGSVKNFTTLIGAISVCYSVSDSGVGIQVMHLSLATIQFKRLNIYSYTVSDLGLEIQITKTISYLAQHESLPTIQWKRHYRCR